jgi:hypothetical protein
MQGGFKKIADLKKAAPGSWRLLSGSPHTTQWREQLSPGLHCRATHADCNSIPEPEFIYALRAS